MLVGRHRSDDPQSGPGSDRTTGQPVACPYLGLVDDARTRFLFGTPAHRCHVKQGPVVIDLQHQARFCLSDAYPTCTRYRAPDATTTVTARATPPLSPPTQTGPIISVVRSVRPVSTTSSPMPGILKPPTTDPGSPDPSAIRDNGASHPSTGARSSAGLRLVLLLILMAVAVAVWAIVAPGLGPLLALDLGTR